MNNLEEKFNRLKTEWRDRTIYLSSIQSIVMDAAYQQIIGMGPAALPFIVEDLRENDAPHWWWALTAITGDRPAEHATNHSDAKKAWLEYFGLKPKFEIIDSSIQKVNKDMIDLEEWWREEANNELTLEVRLRGITEDKASDPETSLHE